MTHRVQCDEVLLSALRNERLDTVDGAFAYGGGNELHKANLRHRRRTRVNLTDNAGQSRTLYLKRYAQERLSDALRRIFTYGWRTSPAGVEFGNILAARAAGVSTMEALICGDDRTWRGHRRSYMVVSEVPGEAIERVGELFIDRHGVDSDTVESLTIQLAMMVGELHAGGYVHRDFYASHVFLDETEEGVSLYLIDLARMFKPRWRAFRWRVKDLGQLKYSMPARWVERHWQTFLSTYLAGIDTTTSFVRWERAIDRRAEGMFRRAARKAGVGASGEAAS
jgi:heptose I phosphotransferase